MTPSRPSLVPPPLLRALRSSCVVAGLAMALGLPAPGARAAVSETPASLRTLLDLAGPDAVDPEVSFSELESLLAAGLPDDGDAVVDGATLPDIPPAALESLRRLGCGSPVLRSAARLSAAGGHADLALLASGPRLAAPRQAPVSGEPFLIRYEVSAGSRHAASARDSDRDGLPDAVGELSSDLRLASRKLSDLVGWTPRAEGIDVVLGATPFAEGAALSVAGARPLIVVPTGLRGAGLLAAVAHQVAHVAVQDLAPGAPESFEEALATYLGEAILAESAGLEVNLEQLLPRRHAARAFLSPGPLAARGDANFLRYLGAELDPAPWLGQVLAAFPRQLDDARRRLDGRVAPLAAVAESLDQALASQGWSLAEAVASYQKWTLEQDLLAHGQAASIDTELTLPAEEERRSDAIPAFGQLRFGIEVPADGGLRLSFDGDPRLSATALLLLTDGTVVDLAVGRQGSPLLLATGNLSRVVMLVQAAQVPSAWSASAPSSATSIPSDRPFSVSAGLEPGYPFALAGLGGEAAPGQVTLSWETSGEQDLVAWWVERAIRPSGPFLRASTDPMPPLSWPGERAAYSFVDRTVRPSTRYHYRVQGVTSSGLRETSATTSVRTLPSPQRLPSSR